MRGTSALHLEHRQEGFLRNLDRADLLHTTLSLLLFLQQLAFAGDVAAVALRGDVLADGAQRLASDHLVADGGLDRDLEAIVARATERRVGDRIATAGQLAEYLQARDFVAVQGIVALLAVIVAIETADLVFAVDSVPAVLAVSDDAFIVYSSNAFAILGLRALYFLLAGMLERFHYLSKGLAIILGFIGVKLVLHALHENSLPFLNGGEHLDGVPDIGTGASLAVIVVSMSVATLASLLVMRRERTD